MDSTGDPHYYVYANDLLLNQKKSHLLTPTDNPLFSKDDNIEDGDYSTFQGDTAA